MMMTAGEGWAGAGSAIASLMFMWAMARQFFPHHFDTHIRRHAARLISVFYPYIEITFPEYSGERLTRSDAYCAIEAYLSGSCTERAKRLKAEMDRDKSNLVLSMDEHEEVTDEYQGAQVWWHSRKTTPKRQVVSFYPGPEDHRHYQLIFHRAQRKLIHESYIGHVMERGKAIKVRRRRRRLYTNNSHYDRHEFKKLEWTHVPFEHPATFGTVAMDPEKKDGIVEDLMSFSQGREFYSRVGKPWKRGYLLYGPPGTGKSTMIAAMANLMDYDVYDLELTAVKDNTALRKLLIETTSKSIIVIEDIDCSLDLSGKRKGKQAEESEEDKAKAALKGAEKEGSRVTLSGLLNFIDGLWSACGSERLIVFTTNHVEQLDPALVRRGRMDMHIELSYCGFPAFKVLAKNYLGIGDHALFDDIRELMEEKDITPADVAESLMPKTLVGIASQQLVEACLNNLIRALKDCKPKAEAKREVEAANGEIEAQKPNAESKENFEAANGKIESQKPMTKVKEEVEAGNGET